MGQWIELEDGQGQRLRAYHVAPVAGPAWGGMIVVQEIFGLNAHIRWVAERWAELGLESIAPAFFDPLEPGLELDYRPEDYARGRELVARLGFDAPLRAVAAAAEYLRRPGRTAVVGYCWGGTVAALAATRLGLPAIGYYGARTVQFLHERLQAPLQLHFGSRDEHIPEATVARIAAAWPAAEVHRYPAGHGFNRFGHPDWHAESAALAERRALEFCRRLWG